MKKQRRPKPPVSPLQRKRVSDSWLERDQAQDNRITVRMPADEAKKLRLDARAVRMTPAQYIRSTLAGVDKSQKLVKALQQYERTPVAGE